MIIWAHPPTKDDQLAAQYSAEQMATEHRGEWFGSEQTDRCWPVHPITQATEARGGSDENGAYCELIWRDPKSGRVAYLERTYEL